MADLPLEAVRRAELQEWLKQHLAQYLRERLVVRATPLPPEREREDQQTALGREHAKPVVFHSTPAFKLIQMAAPNVRDRLRANAVVSANVITAVTRPRFRPDLRCVQPGGTRTIACTSSDKGHTRSAL